MKSKILQNAAKLLLDSYIFQKHGKQPKFQGFQ